MFKSITFSIIVVNYNGYKYVVKCIESILQANISSYEIIVVDNGSTDGSVKKLRSKYPYYKDKMRLISLDKNYGPSRARNEGVKASNGIFLGFLDNDTVVDRNWAANALKEFKKDTELGIIQCKLLLLNEPKKIDYVGEYIGTNGFLIQRAKAGEVDEGQYNEKKTDFSRKVCGNVY